MTLFGKMHILTEDDNNLDLFIHIPLNHFTLLHLQELCLRRNPFG